MVNSQFILVVPQGASGIGFEMGELLKDYFKDPRMVRITRVVYRFSLVGPTFNFPTYQILHVLDDENNQPTVMTNPRVVDLRSHRVMVSNPSTRGYFIEAQSTVKCCFVHFTAPSDTKLYVDIQTSVVVEKDLVNIANVVSDRKTAEQLAVNFV